MYFSGCVDEVIGLINLLVGKYVVILEDIVDIGIMMNKFFILLGEENFESFKIVILLFKLELFRGLYVFDYIGFEIFNVFVVGYGLDYNEYG